MAHRRTVDRGNGRWLTAVAVAIATAVAGGKACAQAVPASVGPAVYPVTETGGVLPAAISPPPVAATPPTGSAAALSHAPMATAELLAGAQTFADAQIVARVGNEVVLAADVLATINNVLYRRGVTFTPEEFAAQRNNLMRTALQQMIESKLVVNDALRLIPKENLQQIEQKVNEQFEKFQVPNLIKEFEVGSRAELVAKLNEIGAPLEWQRRSYYERTVVVQWLQQQVKKEVIPHSRLLGHYHERLTDYEYPAQVRWEELMVDINRFNSRPEAWRAIAELGSRVQNGEPLAEVAQAGSQGLTASKGGLHDWTTKGSLRSQALDTALFTLPIGELSQIIETEHGMHIIRVVERKEAGRTPFTEAQAKIREQLNHEAETRQLDDYKKKLEETTYVWTIFEEQEPLRR